MQINRWRHTALLSLVLAGCTPLSAPYSLQAYTNATSIKADTLRLIDKSSEPYANHAQDIDAVLGKMGSAYEFAHGMAHNQEAAREWDILRGHNLMGEFLENWKSQGTNSAFYISQKKKNMSEAFDYLICLEANKDKATSCAALKASAPAEAPKPDAASTPQ